MIRKVEVKNKYSNELEDIYLTLQTIEREVSNKYEDDDKVYLLSVTKNVENKINDLINKIEYNRDSIKDTINKNFPE